MGKGKLLFSDPAGFVEGATEVIKGVKEWKWTLRIIN